MALERFRLNAELPAIAGDDEKRTLTDLPAGAIVTTTQPLNSARLVEVRWHGRNLMMFALDLEECAEHVGWVKN